MAGDAFGRRFAAVGAVRAPADLRVGCLRVAVSRQDQKPWPALVRHEGVRKPGEGEAALREGERGVTVSSFKVQVSSYEFPVLTF